MRWQRALSLHLVSICASGLISTTVPAGQIDVELRWQRLNDDTEDLRVAGQVLAIIRRSAERSTLNAESELASIESSEGPFQTARPYPRRIVVTGRLHRPEALVRQAYTLLAPAAPPRIEGAGLEVSSDAPRQINAAEHREVQQWLQGRGLTNDTTLFEGIHAADSGRELRVWYEISGRRVDGTVSLGTQPEVATQFDSAFHVTGDGWKIHHARPLYYPRHPFYQRESLELVDTVRDTQRDIELRSYQCGCYGWAIAGDSVTLGANLYHVKVDYVDHRVGAGLFLGFEPQRAFPWLGVGDRERMGLLARRVRAYQLTDAHDEPFAEITIDYKSDAPGDALGPASYEVRLSTPEGELRPLASIDYKPDNISVRLHLADSAVGQHAEHWEGDLTRLDALLAAMPTQVLRGDGIRDSFLGEIETMLDWIRLARAPSEAILADVVSEIDALTAVAKVDALLGQQRARFVSDQTALPLPPKRLTEPAHGISEVVR